MISMKQSLLTLSLAILFLAGSKLYGDNSDNDGKVIDLTILHINDHHSHLNSDTFDYDVSTLGLSAVDAQGNAIKEVEVTYGGFPMIVKLFEIEEAENNNVIKLHAGDAITGTLYYTLFEGAADAQMMNQICFDAFALGNHEFDSGDTGLAQFLDVVNSSSTCKTPTLAANVSPAPDSAIANGYIEPYTIIERDGQQIGIIGIDIAGKTKDSSSPDEGTLFADETTTAQTYIDQLEAMGINKIILLTHYQYASDLKLAAALTGVDVIVGGDSHTLLGEDVFSELGFNPQGDYPTEVTNADGEKVCVVHAWEYAHLIGKLELSFDKDGLLTACSGTPLMPINDTYVYEFAEDDERILDADDAKLVTDTLTSNTEIVLTESDESTASLLAVFNEQVSQLEQQVIGKVASDLCFERWPGQGRSALCDASATYARGSDITNIVAKAFMAATPTADIVIQNSGSVRVDVAAGNYTIADAYTLLPFGNTLVTLEMTGAEIISALEDGLANTLDAQGSTGSYPYASGLRFHVDSSKERGSRISNVEVNPRVAGTWTAIDKSAVYTVATNNYIASGRDGYDTLGRVSSSGRFVDTYTLSTQGFITYIENLAATNQPLDKLPSSEYSTQAYIGRDGCDHNSNIGCAGY